MKVLWLRPSRGENISVRRERIAVELRDRGYEVDIRDTSGLDAIGAIKQAVAGDYDVIAGNVRIGLYLGYPLARILRIPFLGDVSDPISDIKSLPDPLFRFFEWYEWQILEQSDAAVFVYESSYRTALDRGINDAVKLPNAVDYDAFANPEPDITQETKQILAQEGLDFEKPIAIYIGVFSPGEKIDEILATAEVAPNWEFVFVGEGELEQEVCMAASRRANVYYPGSFEYPLMPGFLAHANVGFCFKNAEQPLKLKEYGAAGLPILVQSGELSDFYEEDELIFVDLEPSAIANTLDKIHTDEKFRKRYAEGGKTIAAKWDWAEIADTYHSLFNSISPR